MSAFEVELSGRIAAPPETAWAMLADRDAVSHWLEDVESVSGDGDRLLVRYAPGADGEWIEGTIRKLVPRERLALALSQPSRLLSQADVDLELGPHDGGTSYRLKVACHARPLWSVLSPFLRIRTQVALHRAVRGFRAELDARVAAERRGAAGGAVALAKSALPTPVGAG